ncbi:hypothetical protein HHI36_003453 [Cryptolaemus montrouzieri]|uniref:Uncharacterized protein n=1 Tax=Cryptolaemus montrouzieri TaxID=559131 RepID=A0ABD2PEX4_9CUCU
MIVLMILIELISGPVIGENSVIYMYLRLKFGWNEVDYSIFNSVHFGIQMIGNSFSLTFFSKFLKLDDALLGIIAMTSKILGCLFYAFAPTGFYFYFGAVVEIFHSTNYIAVRAIMAKTVRSEDLGKSNSVFGICESIAPIIFGPLYAKVYSLTLTSFPGSFYLITTVMYAVAFLLFLWLYLTGKKEAKSRGKTVETMKSIELEA